MRRIPAAILAIAITFLIMPQVGHASRTSSSSFRCGPRLVTLGDTKLEVLVRCGGPVWTEVRTDLVYYDAYRHKGYGGTVASPVIIEEWTYNLGPQRFLRTLIFIDDRLVDILLGDYGY